MADDLDPAAVERAARAMQAADWRTALHGGVFNDLPECDRDWWFDMARAALAAARDGGETAERMRPGESVADVLNRWATGPALAQMVVAEVRAALLAARDRAAVDRRAIEAEMMDWHEGRRSWANLGPHAPYTPDVIAVMDAQEVVKRAAILAAPTVTTEQVRAAAEVIVQRLIEYTGGIRFVDAVQIRAAMPAAVASLGIEVREP